VRERKESGLPARTETKAAQEPAAKAAGVERNIRFVGAAMWGLLPVLRADQRKFNRTRTLSNSEQVK